MQLQNLKVILAAMYVVVIGAVGVAAGVTSAPGWAAIGGFALVPAFAMLMLWKHPSQTLSQAIQAARR